MFRILFFSSKKKLKQMIPITKVLSSNGKIIVKREKNQQIHNKTKNKLLYKKEMNSVKWIKHLKDDLAWLLHTRKYKRKEREKNTFWLLNVNLQINNKKINKKKTDKRNEIVLQQMCEIWMCVHFTKIYKIVLQSF